MNKEEDMNLAEIAEKNAKELATLKEKNRILKELKKIKTLEEVEKLIKKLEEEL